MKIQSFFWYLKSVTISGIIRHVYLKLAGKEYIIEGSCKSCGECCRLINLKYEKGWIRSLSQFEELIEDSPEYERFSVVSEGKNGFLQFTCTWLTESNICGDYPERLEICRKYPSKSLYLCGGQMLKGCGYRLNEVVPFKKYLERELKRRKHNE